jgi:hypothetical protein
VVKWAADGSLQLVTRRDQHVEQVIDQLKRLLAAAEAGDIVAISGIAEYRTRYETFESGVRNPYSMAGAHFARATQLTQR